MSVIQNEPVLSAITALVAAAIALLVAFGVALTAPQIAAITGFVGAAYAIGALVRSKVAPVKPDHDPDPAEPDDVEPVAPPVAPVDRL